MATEPQVPESVLRSVADAACSLAMVNTPFSSRVGRRMRTPKPGDLVMEISRARRLDDPSGFGRMVTYDHDEGTGAIRLSDGSIVPWKNATFVAVPTREMIAEIDKQLEG